MWDVSATCYEPFQSRGKFKRLMICRAALLYTLRFWTGLVVIEDILLGLLLRLRSLMRLRLKGLNEEMRLKKFSQGYSIHKAEVLRLKQTGASGDDTFKKLEQDKM